MNKYSKEWFLNYKDYFESNYFVNNTNLSGTEYPGIDNIGVKKSKKTRIEDENQMMRYESEGVVNLWVAAWKMGRLINGKPDTNDNNTKILNGNGNPIELTKLESYLKDVSEKYVSNDTISALYAKLVEGSPKNFGSVYIITLMHFISKGAIPIYDKFAHKAVKALHMGINSNAVFVGDPPEKNDKREVINMLNEYIWLVEQVFGTNRVDRPLDRALWVYGHANKQFDGTITLGDKK